MIAVKSSVKLRIPSEPRRSASYAVKSPVKLRMPSEPRDSACYFDLSIYSYEDEDLLWTVERTLARFGLRVVAREVRTIYMPHNGTELYTAHLRLKSTRPDPQALAKARAWIEAAEAVEGWDVRFEPCKPGRNVLYNCSQS